MKMTKNNTTDMLKSNAYTQCCYADGKGFCGGRMCMCSWSDHLQYSNILLAS